MTFNSDYFFKVRALLRSSLIMKFTMNSELLTIASSIWFCEYENRSSDRSSRYVSEKILKM
jgi:hypothetical protein